MAKSQGWKMADVHNVPPMEASFTKGWHSLRWYFDIQGFGVNAFTRNKGEWLTKEHDEKDTGQQELFIIMEGKAEFTINGKKVLAPAGTIIEIEPEVKRSADALATPTTMLIIGAPAGKKYLPASWA